MTTILFILIATKVFSQVDFKQHSNRNILYPEIINQIEIFNHEYDFQLRFWIHGGISIPIMKDLFVLTQNNNNWTGESYRFIYNKRKKYQIIDNKTYKYNCDSIWQYFLQNNIRNLPDMKSLEDEFYYLNDNGDTAKIMVMDGLNYSFEFINKSSYKRIEYHCPITYSKKYIHIPELKYISNIIRLIYFELGYNYDPC